MGKKKEWGGGGGESEEEKRCEGKGKAKDKARRVLRRERTTKKKAEAQPLCSSFPFVRSFVRALRVTPLEEKKRTIKNMWWCGR